jgi:hypothetical protein
VFSVPLFFKKQSPESSRLEAAIRSNLEGLGYGG